MYSTLGCYGRGGKTAAAGEGRGGAQGMSGAVGKKNDRRKELVRLFRDETQLQSRAEIKLSIRDPSDLRIKHVNSKTVAFQRDLRIHGLRSTIRATVQKVKFLVNSGASFYFFLCYILPPKKNSSSNSAASTKKPQEGW
jgi:hypothetical protein